MYHPDIIANMDIADTLPVDADGNIILNDVCYNIWMIHIKRVTSLFCSSVNEFHFMKKICLKF